jgi:hypothetical protein
MFRRFKTEKGKTEDLVIDQGEPGELAWNASDADDVEENDLDELEDEEDPKEIARREAELQAELQRQAEEFGLTNIDPIALYGPNGESVQAVLEALDELDPDDAEKLADAWDMVDAAERDVVERVMNRRYRAGKHKYELATAEDAVAAWLRAQKPEDDDEAAIYRIVAAAARDAVDAFVLDQDLDDADYDTLAGPWLTVMESDEDESDGADEADEAGPAAGDESVEDDSGEAGGPYGPNSGLVVDFLTRLKSLEEPTIDELVAVWRERPKDELKVAHRALQALADEDERWREQMRLAQEGIFAWMTGTRAVTVHNSNTENARTRRRELAGPAVADAIAALVMSDILEPEDAEVLYAPWAEVVGEPSLPDFEDDETA